MSDFVYMAIFVIVPVLGAILMFFILKQDEEDHKRKLGSLDVPEELDIEE